MLSLFFPGSRGQVHEQKGGRAVAEKGLPQVLVELVIVGRAVPELNLHDGVSGVEAVYRYLEFICGVI